MKKTHIIGIVIIAVSIGVMLSALSDSTTYADFSMANANPGTEYHVVGELDKTFDAVYDPANNPDEFRFSMIDRNGMAQSVVLHKAKPQDFERAEQIVLIGKTEGEEFHAKEILMKCPSKYNDGSGDEFRTEDEMREIRTQE